MTTPSTAASVALDATGADMVRAYEASLQSDKSRSTVGESLRRITRAMGRGNDALAFPWHRLDYESMQAIRQRLGELYPPSTANLSLSAMRQMIKIAFVRGQVSQEQRAAVELLKGVRGFRLPKGRELDDAELERCWAYARAMPPPHGLMLQAELVVLLGGGARREEVCTLPIDACHGDELRILGKGNKERRVYVDAWMRPPLEAWLEVRRGMVTFTPIGHRRLFVNLRRHNNPLSPWLLWSSIEQMSTKLELTPAIAPHDFRRTFASRLLARGFDLSEVQRLMGHASPATTQKYDKRDEKKLADKRRSMSVFAFENYD